jgi:hypothetical protein
MPCVDRYIGRDAVEHGRVVFCLDAVQQTGFSHCRMPLRQAVTQVVLSIGLPQRRRDPPDRIFCAPTSGKSTASMAA